MYINYVSYIVHEDRLVTCIQYFLVSLVIHAVIIYPWPYIFKISDFLNKHDGAIPRQVWLHSWIVLYQWAISLSILGFVPQNIFHSSWGWLEFFPANSPGVTFYIFSWTWLWTCISSLFRLLYHNCLPLTRSVCSFVYTFHLLTKLQDLENKAIIFPSSSLSPSFFYS